MTPMHHLRPATGLRQAVPQRRPAPGSTITGAMVGRLKVSWWPALASVLWLVGCGGGASSGIGADGPRVLAQTQALQFDTAPPLMVDRAATVHAVAGSGLAVRYASLTAEVCSVDASSGRVLPLSAGTCRIAADQAGNADWAVAPQATQDLTVTGQPQQLDLAPLAALATGLTAGDSIHLSATASSGLPVSYRVEPAASASATAAAATSACRIDDDGNTLRALAAGTCRLQVLQDGNTRWAAADVATLALAIAARPQTITLAAADGLAPSETAPLAGLATSGLALAWQSLTPAVCAVDTASGRLTALLAGHCRVQADQAGDTAWAAAAPATLALDVALRPQTLTVSLPSNVLAGDSLQLDVRAGSDLAPAVRVVTPQVCALSRQENGQATLDTLGAGLCSVEVAQAGNARWAAAATAVVSSQVTLRPQTLLAAALPALSAGGEAVLDIVASSGLAPRFTSLSPTVCAVTADGGRVQALAAGSCSISITQPGSALWSAALPLLQAFYIDQRSQSLRFGAAPALQAGGSATVTASASSGLPVRYTSRTPAVCSVLAGAGTVSGLAEGRCEIAADQAGDASWAAAATLTQTIDVAPDPAQHIRFGDAPSLTAGGSASVVATASSGLPVRYASLTPGVCSVGAADGRIGGLTVGTCTLAADQAGNSRWLAAPTATLSFAVGTRTQSVLFGAAPVLSVGGSTTVSATASSGLAVRYTSLSAGVCSIDAGSGRVSGLAAGQCTLGAYQDGGGDWATALPATLAFVVDQRAQSVQFGPAPALTAVGTALLSASASSGLGLRFGSRTPGICTVQAASGQVAGVTAGTCVVTADQDGDATYAAAATVSQSVTVTLATQSLQFAAAPLLNVGESANLSAASSAGLAVRHVSLTPDVCGIDAASGLVSALSEGSCSLRATQTGNATWAEATASLTLSVTRQAQSLSFTTAPSLVSGSSGTVRASASSGLTVRYASLTPAVCTVNADSGAVITLTTGTCTVQASQSGNGSWAPATTASQSIAVGVNPVQTLRFETAPTLALGNTATVRATASSGLAVSYASASPAVCSVAAATGLVSALSLGNCIVTADQAGAGLVQAAVQQRLTLAVQLPAGVTAPGVPSGVTATLGNGLGTVLVHATAVASGGHAISGYTAISSPGGWQGSSAMLPVTVSCATSCAGETFTLQAHNGVGAGGSSAATAVLTVFDVLTTFHEPDTQPRNTVFTGSFTLNSSTGEVLLLSGRLTESMSGNAVGAAPYFDMTQIDLAHPLLNWRDGSLGGRFAASFAKPVTRTFYSTGGSDDWSPQQGVAIGGVYAGFPASYASSVRNSYVLIFVPDNPFAPLTPAQLARLAYADCAPGGMMGAVCMTATSVAGHGAVGTMSGYPLSQVITRR